MKRRYKVYSRDEYGKLNTVLVTEDYGLAEKTERERLDRGFETFVWEV
jgi:hypothetical protein